MATYFDSVRYSGVIKSLNRTSGFGFIQCNDTFAIYNQDVFLHQNQAFGFSRGQQVSFSIEEVNGKPQARGVLGYGTTAPVMMPLNPPSTPMLGGFPMNHHEPTPMSPPRYLGVVKSINRAKGFGFIQCNDTFPIYNQDVFLHQNQAFGFSRGQQVSFSIEEVNGKPQARDVLGHGNAPPPMQPNQMQASMNLSYQAQPGDSGGRGVSAARYSGVVKSINRANGFGFIQCNETFAMYGRDVFLHQNQAVGCSVGQQVIFSIEEVNGQPQARNIEFSPSEAQKVCSSPPMIYFGVIKSMNCDNGFGFIRCPETQVQYGQDVFLHINQFNGCLPGLKVKFTVEMIGEQPQARDVELADNRQISFTFDPLKSIALNEPYEVSTYSSNNSSLLGRGGGSSTTTRRKTILSIGSGDASLSRSLVEQTTDQTGASSCSIVTSFYDDELTTYAKYPEAKLNIDFLLSKGQRVLYNVDATNLSRSIMEKFDLVFFYFPHTGIPNIQEAESIISNQNLLRDFLVSVEDLVSSEGGFVQIALGSGHPYDKWDIHELIERSNFALHSFTRLHKEVYSSYKHCPTIGGETSVISEVADRDPLVYTLKLKENRVPLFGNNAFSF